MLGSPIFGNPHKDYIGILLPQKVKAYLLCYFLRALWELWASDLRLRGSAF